MGGHGPGRRVLVDGIMRIMVSSISISIRISIRNSRSGDGSCSSNCTTSSGWHCGTAAG